MIASELARELGIDVGVMSKRLNMYRQEAGIETYDKHLSEETVSAMREVHALITGKGGIRTREAILRVLGELEEPVPPRSAQQLLERMSALEESLRRTEGKIDFLLSSLRASGVSQGKEDSQASLSDDRLFP